MKTKNDVDDARRAVRHSILLDGLTCEQKALLMGMLVALCWVAGSPNGSTLERLMAGEPIAGSGNQY